MNRELIDFERKCEIEGYPIMNNAKYICLLNDKYLYDDGKTYTTKEMYDEYELYAVIRYGEYMDEELN